MSEEKFELEKIPAAEEGQITKPGYPRLGAYPDASSYGYGYGYSDDDERVYLRQMWRAIKKRKLVIIVMAIIVTSVVTVEVFRNKSVYQASTTIDIGKENRTLVRTGDVVVQTDESDDMFYVARRDEDQDTIASEPPAARRRSGQSQARSESEFSRCHDEEIFLGSLSEHRLEVSQARADVKSRK